MNAPFKDIPNFPPEPEKPKPEDNDDDDDNDNREQQRKLKGAPLADYVNRKVNEGDTLLGERWLCRGGGAFIVAPSGMGKSVMSIQASIQWGVGKRSFGIKPARPFKILILQAEDDEGDTIEMAQIVNHLKLTDREIETLRENVWMEPINDLTSFEFINAIDGFLEQHKADIVIINPYTSYLGADIKDDKANNAFLRNMLNPVVTKHGAAAIIIHHTPKTNFRDTSEWKPSDWMYAGAGAACLTNWARAVLVIDPTSVYGCFKFIAAKRGKRIGWGGAFQHHYSHSKEDGVLLWVPSSEDEIKASAASKKHQDEDVLKFLPGPAAEHVSAQNVIDAASGVIGEKTVRNMLKNLAAAGKIDCQKFKPEKGKTIDVYRQKVSAPLGK
jgi:hypothetical protein